MDGAALNSAEIAFLQHDLDTFGRPNPLATFLSGQQLTVGQVVKLPPEVAADLVGTAHKIGMAKEIQLTLTKVGGGQQVASQVAEFQLHINLAGAVTGGVDMLMRGTLEIEITTCRVTRMQLQGPIRTVEEHGETPEQQYTVETAGTLMVEATNRRPRLTAQPVERR